MNRKLERDLIRLAHGEVSGSEAQRIRDIANGDPEAAKVLRQHETLSLHLNLLRNVPEPQISSERLREALLRDGLRAPAPRSWGFGGLAAACFGIACLAFAFSTVLHARRQHMPMVPLAANLRTEPVRLDKPDVQTPPRVAALAPNPTEEKRTMAADKPMLALAAVPKVHKRRVPPKRSPSVDAAPVLVAAEAPVNGLAYNFASPAAPSTQPALNVAMMKATDKPEASDSQPLVIIAGEGPDMGVLSAQEVGSSRNVVIGS